MSEKKGKFPSKVLLERLADEEHRQRSHWVKFLAQNGYLKKCPEGLKWLKQARTPYIQLSEEDKEKDRKFARSTIQVFKDFYIEGLVTKLQKRKDDAILVIAEKAKELEDTGLTDKRLIKVLREAYGAAGKAEAYEEFLVLLGTKETKQ